MAYNQFHGILLIFLLVVGQALSTDYYKILGVKKDANKKAVTKAYRKLALKYHPDKNPKNKAKATQKFEELSTAYEVINDPEKRRIYDQVGEEGLKPGGGGDTWLNHALIAWLPFVILIASLNLLLSTPLLFSHLARK